MDNVIHMDITSGPVIDPIELDRASYQMMEFFCQVKMYGSGSKKEHTSIFNPIANKSKPVVYFKSEAKFTMEFIRQATPEQIGMVIKDAISKMDEHIKNYEDNG